MKVAVQGYHAGKAWLCICVGVEPPFSKSWIRHCSALTDEWEDMTTYAKQYLNLVLDYKKVWWKLFNAPVASSGAIFWLL